MLGNESNLKSSLFLTKVEFFGWGFATSWNFSNIYRFVANRLPHPLRKPVWQTYSVKRTWYINNICVRSFSSGKEMDISKSVRTRWHYRKTEYPCKIECSNFATDNKTSFVVSLSTVAQNLDKPVPDLICFFFFFQTSVRSERWTNMQAGLDVSKLHFNK